MTLGEYANSLITGYKETLTNFNLVESDTNNSILAGTKKLDFSFSYILITLIYVLIS